MANILVRNIESTRGGDAVTMHLSDILPGVDLSEDEIEVHPQNHEELDYADVFWLRIVDAEPELIEHLLAADVRPLEIEVEA